MKLVEVSGDTGPVVNIRSSVSAREVVVAEVSEVLDQVDNISALGCFEGYCGRLLGVVNRRVIWVSLTVLLF